MQEPQALDLQTVDIHATGSGEREPTTDVPRQSTGLQSPQVSIAPLSCHGPFWTESSIGVQRNRNNRVLCQVPRYMICKLPESCRHQIYSHLRGADLAAVAQVCKSTCSDLQDDWAWQRVAQKQYGHAAFNKALGALDPPSAKAALKRLDKVRHQLDKCFSGARHYVGRRCLFDGFVENAERRARDAGIDISADMKAVNDLARQDQENAVAHIMKEQNVDRFTAMRIEQDAYIFGG